MMFSGHVHDFLMTCSLPAKDFLRLDHYLLPTCPYIVHSLFILVHVLFTTFSHNLFMPCLCLVHGLLMAWSWLAVHNLFMTCSWIVHALFMICLWRVHDFFLASSWLSSFNLFIACSQLVHDMLIPGFRWLDSPYLFITYLWVVHRVAKILFLPGILIFNWIPA